MSDEIVAATMPRGPAGHASSAATSLTVDLMHPRADWLTGDPSAETEALEREFEARLVESSTLAFRVAFSVLRHQQDAEDVAQEAFARAYRLFQQLRDRTRFRAWLVRMTFRLALDRRRADRRRQAREQDATSAAVDTRTAADLVISRERASRLWAAIDALPEKLRFALVLAVQGHEIREVAQLLGIAEGTVKSRLFLARKKLKELLQ
jgi:RNA polymerase sigma-70 factor (ECF subfamily)